MTIREVTRNGTAAAEEALKRSVRELDLGQTRVLYDLADLARGGFRDVFRSQGAAIGARWKPLARSTQKGRVALARKFGLPIAASRPILVNFGDLRLALTQKGGPHHQTVRKNRVSLSIDQSRINRHDRTTGAETGVTKRSAQPKRAARIKRKRSAGSYDQYPNDMIDVQEAKGRKIVGVPARSERAMADRVERYLDHVASIITGGA